MRVGIWMILMAVVLSIAISCMDPNEAVSRPSEPSREIAQFGVWSGMNEIRVTEFRDSSGRVCVLARIQTQVALSCGLPLPPLKYDDLPEVP